MDDLARFELAVDQAVKVPLTDNQFGVLVSFAFNVGEAAFKKSTLLKKLNNGNYNAVPAELARWNKTDGKVLAGLANRRAAETGLWVTGAFVSSSPVVAISAKPALLTGENLAVAGSVLSSIAVASSSSCPVRLALDYISLRAAIWMREHDGSAYYHTDNNLFSLRVCDCNLIVAHCSRQI